MVERHLRRGTAEDLETILKLQRAAYSRNRVLLGVEPLPLLADYQAILRDLDKDVWLQSVGGLVVGILILERRADDLLIESIAMEPAHQGLGKGTVLLEAAEAEAKRLGYAVIRLYTGSPLKHLISWYGRHGFVVERIEAQPDRSITHMMKPLL